jgi:hypothetical protein
MSTAAHPETDGQTERTNRTFEVMIRHFVAGRLASWVDYLPNLEFAYNSTIHSSTGKAPFALNYLYMPKSPLDNVLAISNSNVTIEEMKLALEEARDAITEAQHAQAVQANRYRGLTEFNVGDLVLLSNKHLRLNFREQSGHKFLAPYIGPFKVLQKVGPVAYRLELPRSLGKTHDVFYVGLLKRFDGSRWAPDGVLAHQGSDDVQPKFVVEAILKKRLNRRRNSEPEYFVRWKGVPETDGTWEPASVLKEDVPELVREFESQRMSRLRRSRRG